MRSVDPKGEKLPEIFSKIPKDTPIIMINLLKFRERHIQPILKLL